MPSSSCGTQLNPQLRARSTATKAAMNPEKPPPEKEGPTPEAQQAQQPQTIQFSEPLRPGRKGLLRGDDASRRPSITQVISEKEKKRRKKQKDEEKKNVDIDEHR